MTERPRIKLGRSGKCPVYIDLAKLLVTRMLVQANSGGGKSYAVRVLAEQAMYHVQTIVLDPDGELASLRELHDVLLVGDDGDVSADVRGASLLAQRLFEKRCSAVIDLYELDPEDRELFVRDFFTFLLRIPRAKSHPMLIILDEAQDFCPERTKGQSLATNAVISLMSRGRKRGICLCLALQRMSELNKSASSAANNYLLGRTTQDTDRKRVAQDLGLERSDRNGLRNLDEGQFWAVGPAFSHKDCRKIRVSEAQTTHPEPGTTMPPPPPASKRIRALIGREFADLPARASEEATTLAEAQAAVGRLEKDNVVLRRKLEKGDPEQVAALQRKLRFAEAELDKLAAETALAVTDLERARERLTGIKPRTPDASPSTGHPRVRSERTTAPSPPSGPPSNGRARGSSPDHGNQKRSGGRHRILVVLAQFHPGSCTDRKIGLLAELAVGGGTFSTYIGRLRKDGLIAFGSRSSITITQDGLDFLGDSWSPLPTGNALRDHWLHKFTGGKRRILEALFDTYPSALDREELALQSDLTANAGTFSTYLGKLHTLDLTEGRNPIRASPLLFGDA
jgi:hypothetical protein